MPKSSSESQFIIPDGYSPPFAIVSDTDHTAWIIIATALGMALILLFGAIRVVVRGSICPGVGHDDYFLAASTVFALIQASIILAATADGLGLSISLVSVTSQVNVQQLYYTAILLFVIALGLSKLSVIFFLLRLTAYNAHKRIFYCVASSTIVWMIGSFFALALQCDLSHPWLVIGQHCSGMHLRWQIICAFDIATEVSIVCMSILLVWKLHAPPFKKLAVVITFTFRLLMIIPIVFRLVTFHPVERSSNLFLTEDLFVVWTQTELNYSIISATVPTLRVFATTLNTQFGGLTTSERADHSDSYGKNSSNDPDHSRGSQDALRSPTDTFWARKGSVTPSMSKSSGRQNRSSYNVASLNRIGEPEGPRRFSLQRNRVKKEKEESDGIEPIREPHNIGGERGNDMVIRRDVAYDIERQWD